MGVDRPPAAPGDLAAIEIALADPFRSPSPAPLPHVEELARVVIEAREPERDVPAPFGDRREPVREGEVERPFQAREAHEDALDVAGSRGR